MMMRVMRNILIATMFCALFAPTAFGSTLQWMATTGQGWESTSYWYRIAPTPTGYQGDVPGAGDEVRIVSGHDLMIHSGHTGFDVGNVIVGRGAGATTLFYVRETAAMTTLSIGWNAAGTVYQEITAGKTIDVNKLFVGQYLNGEYSIHADNVGTLDLVTGASKTGRIYLGGYAGSGQKTTGTFTHSAGTVKASTIRFAEETDATNKGYYYLKGGTLELSKAGDDADAPGIYMTGGGGVMSFVLGSAGKTAQITEAGATAVDLRIAPSVANSATFEGSGVVGLTGALDNNRSVIAKSFDTADATLDMSSFGSVDNSAGNTTGTDGWFAVDHGKLTLPSVAVSGNGSYNWAENASNSDIDLVNSMRVTLSGAGTGDLDVALLATDRSDVIDDDDMTFIGVWDVSTDATFSGAVLTMRYDDALATTLGLTEADLKVFHYVGSDWVDVTDSIDTANNRITSSSVDSFSQFAVGVPEPTTLGLLMVGAIGLAVRRRK